MRQGYLGLGMSRSGNKLSNESFINMSRQGKHRREAETVGRKELKLMVM